MTSMAEGARPWRCFWAVPLPADLRRDLSRFVTQLRAVHGVDDDWRFAAPDSWHLTLAFLGATRADSVEPMVERVAAAAAGHASSQANAGGLGGFPGGNHARVLWLGVADADGAMARLAADVRTAASIDEDQPFRAHITLARSRDRRGGRRPHTRGPVPEGIIPVEEVVLFRSHLGGGPARYEALARVPLRVSVAGEAAR